MSFINISRDRLNSRLFRLNESDLALKGSQEQKASSPYLKINEKNPIKRFNTIAKTVDTNSDPFLTELETFFKP